MAIKCPDCTYSCVDEAEMDQHSLMHLKVEASAGVYPHEISCPKCRFVSPSQSIHDAHMAIHTARIMKFEPLKTHISMALAESRSQADTANWEKALSLVQALIDPCPECLVLDCECGPEPEVLARERLEGYFNE